MNDLVGFYFRLLLRRAPAMIAIVVLFSAIATAYAISLPNRFMADATLLVEDPQIPDELAASTVTTSASEQLSILQKQVLSRSNLIEIANELDVIENRREMSPDEVAAAMTESTTIRTEGRRGQANFMFLSFESHDPEIAAAVVNRYVTDVLDQNVGMRTQRASNTLDFFQQEVARLSDELAQQSGRISAFKSENSGTLPDSLNFRLARQAALEERLLGLRRERAAIDEQRQRVISVFEETGRLQTSDADLTPEQRQLRDLESELSSALAIYSEENPRVTLLRTRIEQLQRVVDGQGTDGASQAPATSVFDVTLAELDARASGLDTQISDVEAELEALREAIARTPQTAIALEGLERDYNNVQSQYDRAVARLAQARTGELIEVTAQGQRITVVENAIPPEHPTSPNRKLIIAAGIAFGLGAAAGLFVLLELLNASIRRPGELVSKLGVTPLMTIPNIETGRQRIVRRGLQVATMLVIFVILPGTLLAINAYVVPLSDLVQLARDAI